MSLYLEELRKAFEAAYAEEAVRARAELKQKQHELEQQLNRKLTKEERKQFVLDSRRTGPAAAKGALRSRQQRGPASQPAAAAAALAERHQLRTPLRNAPRPALPGADEPEPGPDRPLRGAVHQPDGRGSGGPIHALLSLRHHRGARAGSSAARRRFEGRRGGFLLVPAARLPRRRRRRVSASTRSCAAWPAPNRSW